MNFMNCKSLGSCTTEIPEDINYWMAFAERLALTFSEKVSSELSESLHQRETTGQNPPTWQAVATAPIRREATSRRSMT